MAKPKVGINVQIPIKDRKNLSEQDYQDLRDYIERALNLIHFYKSEAHINTRSVQYEMCFLFDGISPDEWKFVPEKKEE